MKTLIMMMSLASLVACSHTANKPSARGVANVEDAQACNPNAFAFGGRDPYGDTAQESIVKEFNPRLNGFLSDCEVQEEISRVAKDNSIEVTGFSIEGTMAQLSFNVQDFKKHTQISCKLEAGEGMDNSRTPRGPGPVSTVGYYKKIVRKAVCTAPVRS